jgi:methylisocitrate lyase
MENSLAHGFKTWLDGRNTPTDRPGAGLRRLLAKPGILRVPGAHDALSGLLAKQAGFGCLYLSGAAVSAAKAMPDLGILSMEELCQVTREIYRTTGLPVIVDGDTGYGGSLNAMRLVRELEAAGAAAVQIEDQILPKKCGHLNDKSLVPTEEMSHKIAAARRASSDILIVARTDAAAGNFDDAIARAKAYAGAGADIIFSEALTDDAQFKAFATAIDVPLLANMTEFGRTPYRTAEDFEQLGYGIVIWPVSSLRVAAKAAQDLYVELARTGETKNRLDRMLTRAELYELIGYSAVEALDGSIALSTVPETPDD